MAPSTRSAVQFRKRLFATAVPLSELVERLDVVPPFRHVCTRRSILRPFETMNYLFDLSILVEDIDLSTFEPGNCTLLLYFAVGYYLRAHRRDQLTHTLQNVATASLLLRALPLLRSDRMEAIRNLVRAVWLLRRNLEDICFNRPPDSDFRTDLPQRMRRLWTYVCQMDCMVRCLEYTDLCIYTY